MPKGIYLAAMQPRLTTRRHRTCRPYRASPLVADHVHLLTRTSAHTRTNNNLDQVGRADRISTRGRETEVIEHVSFDCLVHWGRKRATTLSRFRPHSCSMMGQTMSTMSDSVFGGPEQADSSRDPRRHESCPHLRLGSMSHVAHTYMTDGWCRVICPSRLTIQPTLHPIKD